MNISGFFKVFILVLLLSFVTGSSFCEEKAISEVATAPSKVKVTQGKWGQMLVDALPFENSADYREYPNQRLNQLLEGIPDRRVQVDQFKKAINNPQLISYGDEGQMAIHVVEPSATVFYYLVIPSSGDISIKARIKGGAQYWTFGGEPTIVSKHQVVMNDVGVGKVNFSKGGIKRLGISIPKGGLLSLVNIEAKCSSPITPEGGWNGEGKLAHKDMAQTLLQALEWGSKLPLKKGSDPIKVGSKKGVKPKGGLGGFEYTYEDFFIREEGFYSFADKGKRKVKRMFMIDDCLEEEVVPGAAKDKEGEWFTVYLKKGVHTLKMNWDLDKNPGSLLLKKKDNSFKALRKIFAGTEFLLAGIQDVVDEHVARTNILVLKKYLREEEEEVIKGILQEEEEKEKLLKRRSLSPILPQEEDKER